MASFLLGTDDKLEKMELSSDPMLAKLQEKLSGVEAGKPETYTGQLKEILTKRQFLVLICTRQVLQTR